MCIPSHTQTDTHIWKTSSTSAVYECMHICMCTDIHIEASHQGLLNIYRSIALTHKSIVSSIWKIAFHIHALHDGLLWA